MAQAEKTREMLPADDVDQLLNHRVAAAVAERTREMQAAFAEQKAEFAAQMEAQFAELMAKFTPQGFMFIGFLKGLTTLNLSNILKRRPNQKRGKKKSSPDDLRKKSRMEIMST
jgi:hypothetical protein